MDCAIVLGHFIARHITALFIYLPVQVFKNKFTCFLKEWSPDCRFVPIKRCEKLLKSKFRQPYTLQSRLLPIIDPIVFLLIVLLMYVVTQFSLLTLPNGWRALMVCFLMAWSGVCPICAAASGTSRPSARLCQG